MLSYSRPEAINLSRAGQRACPEPVAGWAAPAEGATHAALSQRAARDTGPPDEVHSCKDEIDAASDWLAHIAAGRIPVR